jgi:hypothetical protein
MGTLTVSTSGFAVLPATAPSGWPANIVWPASGSTNGTKSYTISDADWIRLMVWSANANNSQLVGNNPPPVTIAATAVLLALVQNWINGLIGSVQHNDTTPPNVPPPITIA